ncbi:hypothetical protein [Streptomyces purpureus]|uniref:hypothetical protein n=1 Tax=Streptomyces purpureus TaxID=1951 RepID=UPI00049213AE
MRLASRTTAELCVAAQEVTVARNRLDLEAGRKAPAQLPEAVGDMVEGGRSTRRSPRKSWKPPRGGAAPPPAVRRAGSVSER